MRGSRPNYFIRIVLANIIAIMLFFYFMTPRYSNDVQKNVKIEETEPPTDYIYIPPMKSQPDPIVYKENELFVAHPPPAFREADLKDPYPPFSKVRANSRCNPKCQHGWCFINKCFCQPGFEGSDCTVESTKTVPPCSSDSDSCYVTDYGVAVVSWPRWKFAQENEKANWGTGSVETHDRANEHYDGFGSYKILPHHLGDVMEIGAGPFGQIKYIIENRNSTVSSITLWEPGILYYVKNTPHCTYKDGKLLGLRTILVNAGAEDLFIKEAYDTLIIINVLEHVENAFLVMENAYNSLKPGGIFIFNDRWWDKYDLYGQKYGGSWGYMGIDRALHPIRIKKSVFDYFLSHFDPLMENQNAKAFTSRGLTGTYFIGRKKA